MSKKSSFVKHSKSTLVLRVIDIVNDTGEEEKTSTKDWKRAFIASTRSHKCFAMTSDCHWLTTVKEYDSSRKRVSLGRVKWAEVVVNRDRVQQSRLYLFGCDKRETFDSWRWLFFIFARSTSPLFSSRNFFVDQKEEISFLFLDVHFGEVLLECSNA